MNTLPLWFTAGWAMVAVLGVVGGAAFACFIMLPYMRRTEKMMRDSAHNAWVARDAVVQAAEDIRAGLTELRALTADLNKEKVNAVLTAIEGIPGRLDALSKKGVADAIREL